MSNLDEYIELGKMALGYLENKSDQAKVSLSSCIYNSVSVRNQAMQSLNTSHSIGLVVTVYIANSKGEASTTLLTKDSVIKVCEQALAIARIIAPDKFFSLPSKDLLYNTNSKNVQAFYPVDITNVDLLNDALELESAVLHRVLCDNAEVSKYSSQIWQGNLDGLDAIFKETIYTKSIECIFKQNNSLVRDYAYSSKRRYQDLMSASSLASEVIDKTIARAGARSVRSQNCPVLFAPECTKQILSKFAAAISGSNLYNKCSYLTESLGAKVFPDFLDILQDPHLDATIGSQSFDSDGVATSKRHIVKQGVLNSYLLSDYSAKRLGLQTTGNSSGIQTWCVTDKQNLTFLDLLKKMQNGLYVTEMMGSATDLTTGQFSRGIFGFLVVNGAISYPVHEVTISANLQDMMIDCLGFANDDADTNSIIQVGSMLVSNMTISGRGA